MDAIDLLLIASKSEVNLESQNNVESTSVEHLEAVNAILALASTSMSQSVPHSKTETSPVTDIDNKQIGSSDNGLNTIPTERTRPMRRPRAMSEPWTTDYIWQSPIGRHSSNSANRSSYLSSGILRNSKEELQSIAAAPDGDSSSPVPTVGGPTTLTAMEKYASIYNKNGRIGIYTKDERAAIIRRYRDKKKRRVWKKQIRYYCRKNLADRRIRIKGRFVKANEMHLFTGHGAQGHGHAGILEGQGAGGRGGKLGYLVDVLGHINEEDGEEEDEDDEEDLDDEDLALPPLPPSAQKRVRRHSIAY